MAGSDNGGDEIMGSAKIYLKSPIEEVSITFQVYTDLGDVLRVYIRGSTKCLV